MPQYIGNKHSAKTVIQIQVPWIVQQHNMEKSGKCKRSLKGRGYLNCTMPSELVNCGFDNLERK
jgi:hypothetical protein